MTTSPQDNNLLPHFKNNSMGIKGVRRHRSGF